VTKKKLTLKILLHKAAAIKRQRRTIFIICQKLPRCKRANMLWVIYVPCDQGYFFPHHGGELDEKGYMMAEVSGLFIFWDITSNLTSPICV
jgi:hypothetical protein